MDNTFYIDHGNIVQKVGSRNLKLSIQDIVDILNYQDKSIFALNNMAQQLFSIYDEEGYFYNDKFVLTLPCATDKENINYILDRYMKGYIKRLKESKNGA